ncbi:MAG: M61 family metallopeptidase [Vulcanococcus sp.]
MVDVDLDLRHPQQHLVRVQLRLTPRLPTLRLRLPGWTPGSYLIRDYVRNLEGLTVHQGDRPLPLRRLEPACWQLEPDPQGPALQIEYRVLATELSVRTCHLDAEHGFLALAGVVLAVEGERWTPHRLRCSLPTGWQAFVPLPSPEPGCFLARDLDQLLDSPLEAGPHQEWHFSVAGVLHRWVTWAGAAGDANWLQERFPTLLNDVEQVCLACCRLMAVERPAADHYLVVLHLLDEGYGGLEHDDSTVLVYGRRGLQKPDGYRKFLQLVAHEYLHQWNVRRLRPVELTPIDYDRAVPVPSLWFAEGITSYVDQLLPLMAGLSTEPELLQDLGQDLSRYRLTPGRRVQSLRDSSEEAWVKLYRADAYSGDSQVSYYLKGAVLALCLDLHLRVAGGCLAHVLQALWRSHGRWGRGYSERDLVAAFAVVAPDLEDLLPRWLRCVDDPDLDGYLRTVGLSLQAIPTTNAWTGLTAGTDSGQLLARRVQRGGPAEAAGVMVGDELIALDGARLREPEQFERSARAGAQQELLISRRSRCQRLQLQPLAQQPQAWSLVADPEASAEALARRRAWLSLVELD